MTSGAPPPPTPAHIGTATTTLDAAAEWATVHRSLLRTVGRAWLTSGWPTVQALGRDALRRGDPGDVFDTLAELPPPLGHVDHEGIVQLRVRGLIVAPEAHAVLDGYLRVLRLATTRLLSDEEAPTVCSSDLSEVLGYEAEFAARLSELVLAEDWMFGGGSGMADGAWERQVNERTRFVASVRDIDDYLRIEAERLWPHALPAVPASLIAASPAWVGGAGPTDPSAIPRPTSLDASELHHAVASRAEQLIGDGHFDSAVREGAIALAELLRERSGFSLDGADLAGAALAGKEPKIVLADLSTREGRGEQDGWAALACSAESGTLERPTCCGASPTCSLVALSWLSAAADR